MVADRGCASLRSAPRHPASARTGRINARPNEPLQPTPGRQYGFSCRKGHTGGPVRLSLVDYEAVGRSSVVSHILQLRAHVFLPDNRERLTRLRLRPTRHVDAVLVEKAPVKPMTRSAEAVS